MARSRKYRPRSGLPSISESITPVPSAVAVNSTISESLQEPPPEPVGSMPTSLGSLGMSFTTSFPNMPALPNLPNLPNLSNLPNGANMTNVATDLLDAADKRVPTLSVNARRKFFHGLAVLMFVPGVAIDVSITKFIFFITEKIGFLRSLHSHTSLSRLLLHYSSLRNMCGTSRSIRLELHYMCL